MLNLMSRDRALRFGFIAFAIACAVSLFILLAASKANADGFAIMGPNGTTIIAPLGSANPHIINVPQDLSVEAEERFHQWEAFCEPTPIPDRYGVNRLHYKHEGCEYGRTK